MFCALHYSVVLELHRSIGLAKGTCKNNIVNGTQSWRHMDS